MHCSNANSEYCFLFQKVEFSYFNSLPDNIFATQKMQCGNGTHKFD